MDIEPLLTGTPIQPGMKLASSSTVLLSDVLSVVYPSFSFSYRTTDSAFFFFFNHSSSFVNLRLRVLRHTFSPYTGVIQEPSARKKVVKSEVTKVNYSEPKSGDKCRNRKVHLSEVFFYHFSSHLHRVAECVKRYYASKWHCRGRRAAVARDVVYRVICNTTRILLTRGPISDLGGCPRTERPRGRMVCDWGKAHWLKWAPSASALAFAPPKYPNALGS